MDTIHTSIMTGMRRNIPRITDTAIAKIMILRGTLLPDCFGFINMFQVHVL